MTQKDFVLIAEVLARAEEIAENGDPTQPGFEHGPTVQWYVDTFTTKLKEQNPRFDAGRFQHAAMPIKAARLKAAILGKLGDGRRR